MYFLFDLDGTLTDPKEGITACMRFALERTGHDPARYRNLERFIGPPLLESFFELLEDHDEAARALAFYRERFAVTGLFENTLYPGIDKLLASLTQEGHRLFVATAKPEIFAKQIIEHFGLAKYFACVHGSELTGERTDKGELIKFILRKERVPAERAVMIGDRSMDILGARKNALRSVGVTWGYGTEAEFAAAKPDYICTSVAALEVQLLVLGAV